MANPANFFKPGNPGGPGRGLGGRTKTLNALDKMLSKAGNMKKFEQALQDRFNEDPLEFWHKYVLPVIPKDATLRIEGDLDLSVVHSVHTKLRELPKAKLGELAFPANSKNGSNGK